jgi:hypothetical protein
MIEKRLTRLVRNICKWLNMTANKKESATIINLKTRDGKEGVRHFGSLVMQLSQGPKRSV